MTRGGATRSVATVLAALSCAWSVAAAAQEDRRGQSVTARERQRAEEGATQFGAFLVEPRVAVHSTYVDNIYATESDRRGDIYLTVRPEIEARSTWSRHSLALAAYFDRDFYSDYTGENVSEFGVALNGRYDVSRRTRLFAGIELERNAERRGNLASFALSAKPVQYDSLEADLAGEQEFGQLRLRGEGRYRRVSYRDAVLTSGLRLDQKFRDFDLFSEAIQARYDLNGLTGLVLRAEFEQRRYDLRPGDAGFDPLTRTDRSSDSTVLEAGITRDINGLVSATVRIGHLSYRYPDPKLNDVDGFSYYGDLTWNVTPLTTLRATAQRRIDETTSPTTAGNLRDEVKLVVDHELLRTLIVTADARFASIEPSLVDGATGAITSGSDEREFGLGARYYAGRRLRIDGKYTHRRRSSDNPILDFTANTVTIGASLNF